LKNSTAILLSRMWRMMCNADEELFPTIAMYSELRNKMVNTQTKLGTNHYCYMTWSPRAGSNDVLTTDHWNEFANRGYLFARKFENVTPEGRSLLDRIDRELRNITNIAQNQTLQTR